MVCLVIIEKSMVAGKQDFRFPGRARLVDGIEKQETRVPEDMMTAFSEVDRFPFLRGFRSRNRGIFFDLPFKI